MWRHGLLRFARNDGERAELPFPFSPCGRRCRRIRAHHCVISCVTARRANHLKPVQPSTEKYSASRAPQITRTTPPIPRSQEGRIAIVTDVGCGERWPQSAGRAGRFSQGGLRSVSEGRAPTNGVDADGKAVWSWRPLLASSRRRFCEIQPGFVKTFNPPAMEARGIRLQGERGISRKTIAQGMPGCSGCTCMLVCASTSAICTRDRGC